MTDPPADYAPGAHYAERLEGLAAAGLDLHGEARFCAGLLPPGARVLDAGCGTGRVAARLAALGFDCVGVDVDASMLAYAPAVAGARWIRADLADLDLPTMGEECGFDLVLAAGNVIPLVDRHSAGEVLQRLAAHLRPDGTLVTGFGLDRVHLPPQAAQLDLSEYDRWCVAAGLELRARHATWDGDPFDDGDGGYAVNVHRLARPASI